MGLNISPNNQSMDLSENNISCAECEHCFSKNSLFSLLTENEIEILNSTRVSVSFKRREMIYKQGMPLTHLVIIHSGFGKIYIEGPTGKNLILGFTKPYDLNGGIGVFIDHMHHSSLMASNDCETCLIDINSFNQVMASNQDFMNAYLKEYSERVLRTYRQFAILTQKNMQARMANVILYLSENISHSMSINNVSKADLAEFTAMSRESAIRVMKEFRDEKYIEMEDQNIVILNDKALRNIAFYG